MWFNIMSTINKKKLLNEVYDAALVTGRAIGISIISKKVGGMPLNTPETVRGAVKLGVALGASTMLVKRAQVKKYLPVDPFKSI